MARRRRSRRRQRHVRKATPTQPANAQKALQEGQFKTAINAYKGLLKNEQRPEWIAALAEAYEGRCWELAAKGMFKEAVAIWRNRAQACERSLESTHYILWLLHARNIDEALRLYQRHEQALDPEFHNLSAHLATLALAGNQKILQLLPVEDPVVRDHPAALQALQAYCDGDDAGVEKALGRIAFRSPYRDLRTVLKALLEKATHPHKVQGILSRIDETSPFASLALAVNASACDGEQMLKVLGPLDALDRRFILALKGWPESHFVFVQELVSLHQSSGEKHLLRFLIQQQRILGSDFSRQAAMRYVMHHPESTRAYDRGFGTPGLFDRARIIALIDDPKIHSPYEDYEYWEEALHEFQCTFDLEQRQNRLRAALLLRRIAAVLEKGHIEREELKEVLEKSLELDPDDPPTYLHLIRLHRQDRRFKDARRIQDQALARYPQDTEVLLAIVETSIASNAFKKAASFARRILEIDPINPKVRGILFDAHLAHARKQVRQAKPNLALKELEQAAQWDETQSAKERIALIQGIMELHHDRTAGIKRLQETVMQQSHSLKSRFLLLMEADHLQRRPQEVLRLLKLPWIKTDPEQVMELVHTLQDLPQEDEDRASNTLRHLHKPLKKAARATYQQTDIGLICEVFKRYEQPQLRQLYATAALKRWPKTPLFVYHRIDAQMYVHNRDLRDLETALEQAHEAGDVRTAHRIDELMQTAFGFGAAPFPEPGVSDMMEDDLVRELIKALGPEGFLEAMESLNLPDFEQGRKAFGDEQIIEVLERIANDESPVENSRSPFSNPFKKRRKRPQRKPRKSSPSTGSTGESDAVARNDDTKQFDLF